MSTSGKRVTQSGAGPVEGIDGTAFKLPGVGLGTKPSEAIPAEAMSLQEGVNSVPSLPDVA